jgi:hypothetical protein
MLRSKESNLPWSKESKGEERKGRGRGSAGLKEKTMVMMMIYTRSQGLMCQTLTLALKSKHNRYSYYRNHVPKALAALLKVVLSPVRLYLSLSSDYLSLYVM